MRTDPVHPRAGGEHADRIKRAAAAYGSSPRGRGTPGHGRGSRYRARFIPARAGNTGALVPVCGRRPVHPRAGGEHPGTAEDLDIAHGSSPRGRGTLDFRSFPNLPLRFIPARAGNTPCRAPTPAGLTVHPRAGGEHEASYRENTRNAGSSPRGRGTRPPERPLP